MYKTTSRNLNHRTDHHTIAEMACGHESQSEDDIRRNLVRACDNLQVRINAEPDPVRRKALGNEKLALQGKLRELKANRRQMPRDFSAYFMNEAKQILPPAQYEIIYAAARNAVEADEKAREAVQL